MDCLFASWHGLTPPSLTGPPAYGIERSPCRIMVRLMTVLPCQPSLFASSAMLYAPFVVRVHDCEDLLMTALLGSVPLPIRAGAFQT